MQAIHVGNKAWAEELLLQGADANCEYNQHHNASRQNYLALHEATGCEDEALVRLLVEHGADISKTTSIGATALHDAALCGNYAAAQFLLEKGIKVDARDSEGRVALHEAAQYGHEDIVRLLLDFDASASARTNDGTTPTDLALDHKHFGVAQLLLQHRGTFNKNRRGCSAALGLVIWTGNVVLVELLGQNKGIVEFTHTRAKVFGKVMSGIVRAMPGCVDLGSGRQFCATCTDFQHRSPSAWEGGYARETPKKDNAQYSHRILREIKTSAESGCAFCKMILDSLYETRSMTGDSTAGPKECNILSGDSNSLLENMNSKVQLTYDAYSMRYLRDSPKQLWSDFKDKIEARYRDRVGLIQVASLDGEIFTF